MKAIFSQKASTLVASFSRALLEGIRQDMSDDEFDRVLGKSIDEICRASTEKVAA